MVHKCHILKQYTVPAIYLLLGSKPLAPEFLRLDGSNYRRETDVGAMHQSL